MIDTKLTYAQWERIRAYLTSNKRVHVGSDYQCRRFLETVLWMSSDGAQWRLIPARYGKWNSIYKRFMRWCEEGIWEEMQTHFANDFEIEQGLLRSPVVYLHSRSALGDASRDERHTERGIKREQSARSIVKGN